MCGDDDTCLTRCEIDADCSQGYACDETAQRCLPAVTAAESCRPEILDEQGDDLNFCIARQICLQ